MPRQFVIVDAPNLFHRSRHVAQGDAEDRLGLCTQIIFKSVTRMWNKFNGDHVVMCFDDGSWRSKFYPPYKQNRRVKLKDRTPAQCEEDEMFLEGFGRFRDFAAERTNMTVLRESECEADDFIARWIELHPDDSHVIVSTDSDFHQLVGRRVSQYSGVSSGRLYTIDGILDADGERVRDPLTGAMKEMEDPEWLLFEKIVRGDSADNIFSACPGARKKGTRSKVGLLEAFADRHDRGYAWNNFMLQKWKDHKGEDHVVRDDYRRNRKLIDLSRQPKRIVERMDAKILSEIGREPRKMVGVRFIQFCNLHDLPELGKYADSHADWLDARYR